MCMRVWKPSCRLMGGCGSALFVSSGLQVDMTGIEALAKMISINSSLTRLNFAKNALGSEGFEILLPSIK